ncbi:MAG: sigma-54-dependent transcriptional regulator [Desulfatibacillaceae bacterium]
MHSILIITPRESERHTLVEGFSRDREAVAVATLEQGVNLLKKRRFEFVFADLDLLLDHAPEGQCSKVMRPFQALYPTMNVIVIAESGDFRKVAKAMKAGAADYVFYPVEPEWARQVVDGLADEAVVQSELDYLRGEFWEREVLDVVRTKSPSMRRVFGSIRSVAPTRSTVLLVGETGVGKGVMAKLIHGHSHRKRGPFISVHCGAIPDSLLESELFGHEKGAFTGAVKRKLGRFEIARGGTIFLDEIATITPEAQVKLLQVLQDGTFTRVGGEATMETDARVIAATNMDLAQMAAEGSFRKDLYYRLNVFPIHIPPLAHRGEDVVQLARYFLGRLETLYGKGIQDIDAWVLDALRAYSWPGNIRELENLIERAYILEHSQRLTPDGFPGELFLDVAPPKSHARAGEEGEKTLAQFRREVLEEAEYDYLEDLLERHRGRINETARAAGITTRQLHKLMVKYGLKKERYRRARA